MKWSRIIHCNKSEASAVGCILMWVVLYFNIYRFTSVEAFGQKVPLELKLISFSAFLLVALFTVNGIYKGIVNQKRKTISAAWFLADFCLSMAFAILCADRQLVFRVLSLSIFAFDRLLYYLVYRKEFQSKVLLR